MCIWCGSTRENRWRFCRKMRCLCNAWIFRGLCLDRGNSNRLSCTFSARWGGSWPWVWRYSQEDVRKDATGPSERRWWKLYFGAQKIHRARVRKTTSCKLATWMLPLAEVCEENKCIEMSYEDIQKYWRNCTHFEVYDLSSRNAPWPHSENENQIDQGGFQGKECVTDSGFNFYMYVRDPITNGYLTYILKLGPLSVVILFCANK